MRIVHIAAIKNSRGLQCRFDLVKIRRAELDVLGGHVSLAPFGFNPAKPAVETAAAFSHVALGGWLDGAVEILLQFENARDT